MPRRLRVLLVAILVAGVVPALAGCVASGEMHVVASSHRLANGVTFAVVQGALVGKGPSGQASYEILYQGERVYPPLPFGATFLVENGRGITFVPYNVFVVGNGDYEIRVRFNGEEESATTRVDKWVQYVYLRPFDRGSKVVVDLQLSRAQGGAPIDRIVAEGDLRVDIRYRGATGTENEYVTSVRTKTPADESFTRLEIPKGRFAKPGYYSFDAVFHNDQANGNTWVKNDPALAGRNPPLNWVYVSR